MPTLTDYHVLIDGPKTLNFFGNEEFKLNFNPANDIRLDNQVINRPVLSYRVDPSNDANGLKFKAYIRNKQGVDKLVSSFTLTGTVSRTVFEAVSSDVLHSGNNPVIFKIEGGIGSAKVSDVIFWFKRSV